VIERVGIKTPQVLLEGYPWQTLNSQNSSSLFLLVTDSKEKPALILKEIDYVSIL
jgi:hypothetical protein